jgi:hypothetical protein
VGVGRIDILIDFLDELPHAAKRSATNAATKSICFTRKGLGCYKAPIREIKTEIPVENILERLRSNLRGDRIVSRKR